MYDERGIRTDMCLLFLGEDIVPTMASLDTPNEPSGKENHAEDAPNGPEDEGTEGYQGEIVQVTARQCT